MQVRLLPAANWDGAANMAADEVMLEVAIAGTASFRLYTWNVPTVSLGYFQPARERESQANLSSLPFVRRSSGGAMLIHHHELTYALALPAGPDWQPRGRSWICQMHEAIAHALQSRRVDARLVDCDEERKLGQTFCFLHQTPGDLLIEGHKVAGSAQRKSRGALLQHGGMLLRRSMHAPALAGISDLAGIELSARDFQSDVTESVQHCFGWKLQAADWSSSEMNRLQELAQKKYAGESWNLKR